MKSLFSLIVLAVSFQSFALDCSSVGSSSCTTTEGMCVEYVDGLGMPEAQLKSICQSMQGTFTKATCGATFNQGSCINEMNPIMPIIRFDEKMDAESAEMFCTTMGGQICK